MVNLAWPGTAAGAAFWEAVLGGQDLAFDLALSEISITPERAQQVTFSLPYYRTDIGVMAKASRPVDLARIRALRIGVQAGTTGAAFVADALRPDRPARSFGDAPGLFTALQSGVIDVAMTDTAQSLIDDGTVAELTATWLSAVWGQDPATVPYLPLMVSTDG